MHRTSALVRLAVALGVAACFSAPGSAAPPPPQEKKLSRTDAAAVPGGAHQVLPDITVNSVWIASGPVSDAWTPLPPNPNVPVGETLWLGCDVGVSGTIPRLAFKVAWYVDGAKTCGEGSDTVQNPPVCEFAWPLAIGTKTFISYVPHAAGSHTYKCGVDVGNQVAERNETNNAMEIPFSAFNKTAHFPVPEKAKVPIPKTGPRLLNH